MGAKKKELDIKDLKGVKALGVLVDCFPQDSEPLGFTEEKIRAKVESKLRAAGIKVVSQEECILMKGQPCLGVKFDYMPDDRLPAYDIEVAFLKNIFSSRNGNVKECMRGFHQQICKMAGEASVHDAENELDRLVERFLESYLSVNPKL